MCTTTKNGPKPNENEKAPPVCQFWISLHNALPAVGFAGMDITLTVFGALFLTTVRYSAEIVLIQLFGWPENAYVTKNACGSIAAITHSSFLVPGLMSYFWNHGYNPSESLYNNQTAPAWCAPAATALLQFCTGYMIYDGLVNCLWLNWNMAPDVLHGEAMVFLGHHIATILYMSSTRALQAGHQSAMVCMLLGEITNPFHNSYYVAEAAQALACCNGDVSQMLFSVVEFLFSSSYFFVRGIVSPPALSHLTFCLWWRAAIPLPSTTPR